MNRWIDAFKGVYFGLGLTVMNRYHEELIRAMDLDRILLESDAPLQLAHSWRLPDVARHVGQVKGVPPAMVMELGRLNARKLFGI